MPHRPSRHRHRRQRDLFEADKAPVILDPCDRLKLAALAQAVLTETLSPPPPARTEEAGDDQAHR